MGTIAHGFRWLLDLTIWPFEGMGPFVTLTISSVITALAILLVVRYATPASWITKARAQIAAAIYEVRLFLDSPVRVIKSQGRLLGYTAVYIAALLPALIIMTLPMGLLYLQLDLRYGVEPVPVGDPMVVTAVLEDGVDPKTVAAETGEWGVVTATVRDPSGPSIYWRLVVKEAGSHTFVIAAGPDRIEKRVDAAPELGAISSVRTKGLGMWWQVTGESPIDSDMVAEVRINQETKSTDVLRMPWWVFWLLLSTILALVLRKPFKVTL